MSTQTTQNNTTSGFVLVDYTGEENQLFIEEVGTLVFQSALMKYLAIESEKTAREFETFINLNIGSDDFMESLCTSYPLFNEMLNTEMNAFRSEMNNFTKI
jgi:hypothetical protein